MQPRRRARQPRARRAPRTQGHRHRPARRRRRPTGRDAGSRPVASGRVRSRPVASGRVPRLPVRPRYSLQSARSVPGTRTRHRPHGSAARRLLCIPLRRESVSDNPIHTGVVTTGPAAAPDADRDRSPGSLPRAHFVSVSPAGFPTSIAALATVSAASALPTRALAVGSRIPAPSCTRARLRHTYTSFGIRFSCCASTPSTPTSASHTAISTLLDRPKWPMCVASHVQTSGSQAARRLTKSRSIRMSLTHPAPPQPSTTALHDHRSRRRRLLYTRTARASAAALSHTSRGVTFMHDHTRLSRETQHKATVRARHAPQQPSSATILLGDRARPSSPASFYGALPLGFRSRRPPSP